MLAATQLDMTIDAVSAGYRAGRTPAEVLAEVLSRSAAYPRKGVWITRLDQTQIDRQLHALETARRAGEPLPLYGIPFAVKDNIDVAGIPTTAACPAFAYTPDHSATSVRRLTDAGAIVVGKTNLDQFATGLVGIRSPYGACENAFNPEYISGGSSSGSAVAVAGGLVSFALGTDTAGSGRVPAAFNNIVGLKPTRGLISAAGVVPACRSLDCVSIFAANCADAQAVLQVAAGPDDADFLSRPASPPPAALPQKFRVGIPQQLEFFGNRNAESLYQQACRRIEKLGGQPVTIDFTPFMETANLLYNGPWVAERLLAAGSLFAENPAALRPELRIILEEASRYSAADAFAALHQLAGLRRRADAQWARMDILLAPTAGTIYRIAQVEADPMQLNRNLSYYTNFVNLLDLSALALPAGFLSTGLPWGVTLMAPAFHENRLLSLGAAFHAGVNTENAT